jgi:hypothetical protein
MARKSKKKKAEEVKQLFDKADNAHRHKWQYLMTKCHDLFFRYLLTQKKVMALSH